MSHRQVDDRVLPTLYTNRYSVVAAIMHVIALFLLSYQLVLSPWLVKSEFEGLHKLYYWAFWFNWLDLAQNLGLGLTYGGDSFSAPRIVYFALGIVLTLGLWVLPLLTPLPDTLRGAALQVCNPACLLAWQGSVIASPCSRLAHGVVWCA